MKKQPKKNPAAQALGRLGGKKPKTLTPAALQQRRAAGFQRKLPRETVAAAREQARDDHYFNAE